MSSLFADMPSECCGFRLDKLELYNWGTFDSSRGSVHTVRPGCATTLLIGQNGSGKSTLVDAILTLLVRPGVRNYNVAAGAQKQERDERSYIKGAYGRFSRDEDNRAEVQFLRGDGKQYSAILACFRNGAGQIFTAALVLYLSGDGSSEKVYCVADREMSIAEHCANLHGTERVRQQLEKRGFRATNTYTEYFSWFQRRTGVKPKAMDMFNQTVAVKDIQSLNRFIRDHMLESKPWRKQIEDLQLHFSQLSQAHQSLVRVRDQSKLLAPIAEKGRQYTQLASELSKAERLQAAAEAYFRQTIIDLFVPECAAKEQELIRLGETKREQDEALERRREEIRRLTNEIEQAGGDRLKQLPLLIQGETDLLRGKQNVWQQFCEALKAIGLPVNIHNAESFAAVTARLPAAEAALTSKLRILEKERDEKIVTRAELITQRSSDSQELESLRQRKGNLPDGLATMRLMICENLRIPELDLPFVAELVAVKPGERAWQASIEVVLRGVALSLLVPHRHYAIVSAYINRTRLLDHRGQGQRLHYVRVGEPRVPERHRPIVHSQSLLRKLDLREDHPMLPWVQAELNDRFNFRCCETIEEFQSLSDLALTRERHIKWNSERHQKDDRDRTADPRNFVLGWENKEKRRLLADGIARLSERIDQIDRDLTGFEQVSGHLRAQEVAADRVRQVTDFGAIDFERHAKAKDALEREKQSLEEGNDAIRILRERVTSVKEECQALQAARDRTIGAETLATSQLNDGRRLIMNARARLAALHREGALTQHEAAFAEIRTQLADREVNTVTLFDVEQQVAQALKTEIARLGSDLAPVMRDLVSLMGGYLQRFRDEQADLAAHVDYIGSFETLYEHIRREDLPRHESRFKEHMNEKVIHEIGLLNGAFMNERTEIATKIGSLNDSLRQLEYRQGTYMTLEPKEVHDREIIEFREALRECLSGSFEGTLEADEARYVRIEKLLARLREDSRWCDKVTDVRRWFDFAAIEIEVQTGAQRSYHEDSAGQSGGEKAKLAFTILVAAIAYQYDLDPAHPSVDRFQFVVVDEMFSKVDDQYSEYALELFKRFGLQLLIVAPLDSKARVTESHVGCYLHVVKDPRSNCSEIFSMTAREFDDLVADPSSGHSSIGVPA